MLAICAGGATTGYFPMQTFEYDKAATTFYAHSNAYNAIQIHADTETIAYKNLYAHKTPKKCMS